MFPSSKTFCMALGMLSSLGACASSTTSPSAPHCVPMSAQLQLPSQRCAISDPPPRLQVDAPAAEAEAAARRPAKGRPLQVAVAVPVQVDAVTSGRWIELADGARLWQLQINAPGARHVALHFGRLLLPPGAQLHLASSAQALPFITYDGTDTNARNELWTAQVHGEQLLLEVWQPAASGSVVVQLDSVFRGFR